MVGFVPLNYSLVQWIWGINEWGNGKIKSTQVFFVQGSPCTPEDRFVQGSPCTPENRFVQGSPCTPEN